MSSAYAVPSLKNAATGERFQFERLGKIPEPSLCMNILDICRLLIRVVQVLSTF